MKSKEEQMAIVKRNLQKKLKESYKKVDDMSYRKVIVQVIDEKLNRTPQYISGSSTFVVPSLPYGV